MSFSSFLSQAAKAAEANPAVETAAVNFIDALKGLAHAGIALGEALATGFASQKLPGFAAGLAGQGINAAGGQLEQVLDGELNKLEPAAAPAPGSDPVMGMLNKAKELAAEQAQKSAPAPAPDVPAARAPSRSV